MRDAREAREERKKKKRKSGEMHHGDRSGEGKKEGREKRGSQPLLVTEISLMREREKRRKREREGE